MTITEKVAYVKGLAEGLELSDDNKTERILKAVIDVLDDMALTVADIDDMIDEITDQVDAIDEDLSDVEEYLCDEDCGECDDEDEYTYAVTCPTCDTTIYLSDEDLQEDGITCPECGEDLEFDFDDEVEED
jgi:hypothetical protein